MVFNKSQYYEIIQYGKSLGLDPKIFEDNIIKKRNFKTLFGFGMNKRYSLIGISGTNYFFRCGISHFSDELYEGHIYMSPDKNQLAESYITLGVIPIHS